MILKKVVPIHFGPFSAATQLIVDPEVTVLTGANDSGKSSMLRLISHIYDGTPIVEENFNHDRLGAISIPWDQDIQVGCLATFLIVQDSGRNFTQPTFLLDGDIVDVKFTMAPKNPSRIVTEIRRGAGVVSTPTQVALHRALELKILPLATEVRDTINLKNMNDSEKALIKLGFGKEFTFENFQSTVAHRRSFRVQDAEIKLNRVLNKVLPSAMGLRFSIRDSIEKPELLAISLIDKHSGFSPVGSRGTGVQKILNVMGTLMMVEHDKHTIILYDEPETSLHADSQHLLRGLLEELGRQPRIQVIYVTHSPSMINTMRPASIRVFTRNEVNGVATSRIESAPYADNYISVRSSLGLSPSDSLLYAPITVVVEGRTEVRCLYLILKKLKESGVEGFEDFEQVLSHAHFLDGNGDTYELLLRVAKSQNVGTILLLDGDKRTKLVAFKRDNPDVPVVFLSNQKEFEEIIPHGNYITSLAGFLGDTSGEITEEKFEEWIAEEWVGKGKKRRGFSKEVEYWVGVVFDRDLNKPLVMERAIQDVSAELIDAEPFKELMASMRKLLPES